MFKKKTFIVTQLERINLKLSNPLMSRFDIQIFLSRSTFKHGQTNFKGTWVEHFYENFIRENKHVETFIGCTHMDRQRNLYDIIIRVVYEHLRWYFVVPRTISLRVGFPKAYSPTDVGKTRIYKYIIMIQACYNYIRINNNYCSEYGSMCRTIRRNESVFDCH